MTAIGDRLRHLATQQAMGVKLKAEEIIELKKLSVENNKYHAALVKVDAMMGRHQRQVGNYALQWNGLTHSINQLTREAPAFANSMQTGFMAISNNIPMLFDELSAIKRLNEDLIKQGKPAESSWKQLGKAVFSLQTLLSLGVTLLTVYGAKIVSTIAAWIEGAKAIDALVISKKLLNESTKEGTKNAQEELVKLKINLGVAKDTTKSYLDRTAAVKELQKTYPAFLGNLSSEAILAGQTTSAEKLLTEAILQRAKAQAAIGKITEIQLKVIEAEEKLRKAKYKVSVEQQRLDVAEANAMASRNKVTENGNGALDRYNEKLYDFNEARREQTRIEQEIITHNKVMNRLTDYAIDNTRTLGEEEKKLGSGRTKRMNERLWTLKAEKHVWSQINEELKKYEGIQDPKKLERILYLEQQRKITLANIAVIEAETALKDAQLTGDKNLITQAEIKLYEVKVKQLDVQKEIDLLYESDPAKRAEIEAQYELNKKNLQVIDETGKSLEKNIKIIKAAGKLAKEVGDIVSDYFQNKLQSEIEMLDNYLAIVNQNYAYLADKAAKGNLQAEESLKAQLKLQKELNDEKYKAQQNLAKWQAITGIIGGIGSLAGSIQGFATGTESEIGNYVKPNLSGVGIDNTLVRVHGKERIINGELSKAITGHKTSEVVKGFLNYKQMANGQVGYSVDLSETNRLLKEVASKSVPNWELGEIGQGFMDVVKREVNGNKETVHIYRNKYR